MARTEKPLWLLSVRRPIRSTGDKPSQAGWRFLTITISRAMQDCKVVFVVVFGASEPLNVTSQP